MLACVKMCPHSSGVEHFLGKEEVTGSIPVVGLLTSKRDFGGAFSLFFNSVRNNDVKGII